MTRRNSEDIEPGGILSPNSQGHTTRENSLQSTTSDKAEDPNIIDWDGPDDPTNPMNWSSTSKSVSIGLVSILTFLGGFGSTVFAPSVPELMKDFHSSDATLSTFVISVYLIGWCIGPLVLPPLSELYGRNPIYHASNVFFMVFSVACAVSTNLPMFIVFRFFMGLSGCPSQALSAGTVADLIPLERRGVALSAWGMGPLLGPVAGPIVGGFMAESVGWRWIFWMVTLASGVVAILCSIFLHETYAPAILARKTARLRRETGNLELKSKYDKPQTASHLFKAAIIRPSRLLFCSPIVTVLALDVSIAYSYNFFLFSTYPYVFVQQYGFKPAGVGLAYLGLGVGFVIGQVAVAIFSDRYVRRKQRASQEVPKPEWRLPPLIVGTFLLPLGLLWYGWTAYYRLHWILPLIGTTFIGGGTLCHVFSVMVYLIDVFTIYSASALAANSVARSAFAATLPLAGKKLYDTLGVGWGNSLLALFAFALSPVPFVLLRYGERIRTHTKFRIDV